ncbi:MAG: SDR family oxidoreductase [Alphaproteobacteria bacterium]|nr:MAG: SDR family oxidoreductase [Alphaproteobacteria bacterium]
MTELSGKTALVTGALKGIGRGVAEVLAAAGARIAVHGRAGDAEVHEFLEHLEALGAPQAKYFHADLRDPAQIEEMMEGVRLWGGADIIVNNAGMQATAPMAEMKRETWDQVIAVNLSAAFDTMRLGLPVMAERGYGRVINIASVHGLVASKEKAPYVSSKFGIVGLTKVGALEYARAGTKESGGVTVNAICPGWVETALIEPQIQARAARHGGDRAAGIADMLAEKQPTLRTSDPEEIGHLVLWLCSRHAHNITGAAIPVDGGWSAQ